MALLLFTPIAPPAAVWPMRKSCSRIREGSLESLMLLRCHFFLLSPHFFLTASAPLLPPELQLLSFSHFLVVQLFHALKFFWMPHPILPHYHDLVLMVSGLHLLYLLTSFFDVVIHLVLLLFLHPRQGLPALSLLVLKGTRLCESRWPLSVLVKLLVLYNQLL